MNNMKDLTVDGFIQLTASDAPAPGGGSVSALIGALAAALSEMVANLTVDKEKYAASREKMLEVIEGADAIRAELTDAIDRDSSSFNQYMAALSMPKGTDEEKAVRRAAMQEGLKAAALVPLDVAASAVKILPLARLAVTCGNTNAVTDGLVSAMAARTAVLGALLNTKINLASIKDETFVRETEIRVAELEQAALAGEREILALSGLTQGLLG